MQPVTVLAIAASPRAGGNTDALLTSAVDAADSVGAAVETLALRDFQVGPCIQTRSCDATGKCVVDDDYQLFYRKFLAVDRIIIASPVYFMGVPAQAKALVDRCQCIWARKYLLKKRIPPRGNIPRRGYLLSAGGHKSPDTFDCLKKVMKFFFLTLDMEFSGDLCVHKVDAPGDIEKHPDALKKAWELGLRAASPV